jgi:acylphosphatase
VLRALRTALLDVTPAPHPSPAGQVVRRRVVVHGIVQGVYFRASLARAAETRGVAGWARNRPDGTVEAALEGRADDVAALVSWCERGPRGAVVDRCEVTEEPPEGLTSFGIR